MYKDVKEKFSWKTMKKVLAVVVSICLVVTIVQLPGITAHAEDGVVYHDYWNSAEGEKSAVEEKTVAAMFTINQNTDGAEQLESVAFDLQKNIALDATSANKATATVYVNPTNANDPTSGTYLCQVEGQGNLDEGTNRIQLNATQAALAQGTVVAVVVSLNGDDFSFQENASDETGKTLVQTADGWVDAGTRSQCLNISLKTSDVADKNADVVAADATDDTDTVADEPQDDIDTADVQDDQSVSDAEENAQEENADAIDAYSNEESGIALTAANPIEITDDMIELVSNATASSDGSEVRPIIKVTYQGTVLEEGTDYTCSVRKVSGNSWSDVGTEAQIVVTGMGSYTSFATCNYRVCADIATQLDVSETLPAQTYTGSAITLNSLYTIHSDSNLTAEDLNVEYKNNLNAGEATVTISPKTSTDFGGKIEKTFTINKVDISTLPESAFSYDKKVVYNPTASVTPPTVTVSYNNNTLSAGADYKVTASGFDKAGNATITLDADNGTNDVKNYTGEKSLPVTVDSCSLSGSNITVTLDNTKFTYTGSSITPGTIVMKYGDTTIYEKGDNKSLFKVTYKDAKGGTNTTDYGVITGTIEPTDTNTNYTGAKTFTYEITKTTLSSDNIELTHDDSKNYNNAALVQYAKDNGLLAVKLLSGSTAVTLDSDEVTLKDKNTGHVLTSSDFSTSYQYNKSVSTSSSRAQVTFTGKGNYTGSMTVSFLIAQDISTLKNIPTSFDPLPYKGNGKEVTYADGAVVIKNDDSEILTQGEDSSADYTVEYSDNTAIGTATYKIIGNGNVTSKGCFVGSVEKNFTITKKNLADEDVVVTINPVDYKEGTSETVLNFDQIEVKYGEETLQGGASRDYIIQGYEGNHKCGTAYVTLQGVGDNYTGTKTVPFQIRGKEITAANGYSVEVTNYTYTGGNIIPEIKVIKDKGEPTEAELDRKNYTISYQQNGASATPQDVGEYDIIVSGNNDNNYTGTLTASFSILQRPVNDTKITQNQISATAYSFTGNQVKPKIVLSHELSGSTIKLVEGTDYTVAYENNVNAGEDTAKAIVTGMGNYSGTREITFSIAKKSLKEADVVIEPVGVQAYTGKAIEPKPTVTLGDYELKEGVDFEYYYSNNVEIGTNKAKVGIRAKEGGNFQLTKEVTFSIQASISSNCDMYFTDTVDESNECFYTGSAIRPGVKIVDEKSGATLRQGADYVVTYSDNTNAGTATVSIRGIGSYTSSMDKTFTIKPVEMEDVMVNLTNASNTFTYTGSQIMPTIRSITYGNYTLASNDTYNVAYGANTNVADGGTISITSTGNNFTGTKEVAFTIAPKDISKSATAFANDIVLSADGETVASIPTQSYTGTTITPDILLQYKVSATDTKALALNTDYTVLIENNIDPGVATMTFTGTANYTGTVKQNFTIARDISGATVEGIEETYPYTGNEIKVEDNLKVSLVGSDGDPYQLDAADYNVTYKDDVKAGTATVTISGNEKNFYTGSIEKTFKIKANFGDDSTTVAEIEDVPRDPSDNSGKTYHPEALEITCGGNTFNNAESNENYDVTYENDTKIGTATLTLTGKGDFYEGTKTVTYDIVPANSTFKVVYKNGDKIPDQKFCGKEITFDPESEDFPFTVYYVEEDGTTERELVYGTDYELKYNNNVNANVTLQDDGSFQDAATKAEVVINGIGKYKHDNKKTCTFTILPLLLDDLVINDSKFLPEGSEDVIGPREYTGKTVTPSEIQIQNVDAETGDVIYTLTKEDYTLTPETELTGEDGSVVKTYTYEAGSKTACVTIKGNGQNCIGTKTIEYDIAQMDIKKTKITTTAQEYTGYALQPDVQVVNPLNDNAVLVLNDDYFLEYENNVDAGVATVRVVANDTDGHNFKGSAEATFKINPIAITASSITVDEIPSQDYSGAGVTPDVAISYTDPQGVVNALHEGTDYELSYANNTKAGTARVTIAGKGNFTGTTAKPFTINPCNIEDNVNITIDPIGNQAYTGSNITPNVTVHDRDYQMKSGVDYTVTYTNNKELGTATATVVGKGNYKGSLSTTFQIASDISKAVIGNGVAKEYTYTGTEICPVPSNVHIGTTNLVAGTDYTVSYEENINAGTGKVILSGMGTYGGTLEQEFTIKQKDISDSDVKMTGYTDKATYTETEVTLPIGFTYGTMTLEQDTDFAISYTDNFALGTAYFEVVGLGNYTGTITKKFEIVKKSVDDSDITVTDMSSTYTYEGEEIAPVPTLNNGDEKMTPDIDYTVAYENNNGVGVATMTITGIGRYQGTREVKYNILRKSVVNCKTSSVGTQIYTGSDIEPTVTVKDGEKDLVKGTDYTIMYANNRKSGSGSVIIAGKGNYTVTKTVRFDIRPGGTSSFMVNATTNDSIGLAWGAQGVVTGYEIYRADASGNYTRIARTRGTSYTDKGLNAGTAYTYKVRAYLVTDDETYYSNFSDGVTGTTNN